MPHIALMQQPSFSLNGSVFLKFVLYKLIFISKNKVEIVFFSFPGGTEALNLWISFDVVHIDPQSALNFS